MDEQQIKATMARHAATPEVSVHEYVDRLTKELHASISGKRKLYLDTRYWIHLRDAAMGRPTRLEHSQILDCVRMLVSTGAAICPISDVAWLELSKQSDPATRRSTAVLLDELSLGIAIMTERERVIAEIEQFITRATETGPNPILRNRVWVRAGYVLGVAIPTIKEFSRGQNLLTQKTSVDLFWQISIQEMLETTGSFPTMPDSFEESAAKITAAMQRYAYQIRSIKQAFTAEIAGALRVFKDDIGPIVLRHFERSGGDRRSVTHERVEQASQKTLTALINAFVLKPKIMAQRIPSLYASAMCHAAVRMDKSRTFNGHDLLDIHHASSGIPYHDAVFTENPLRVLVTGGNVRLDRTFECAVLSQEHDVLSYLRGLSDA